MDFPRQPEVAGNPKQSFPQRLETADNRFCPCVACDFQSLRQLLRRFFYRPQSS